MEKIYKRKGTNPGAYIETKSGKKGRTKNSDEMRDGKVLVYIMDDKFQETGERLLILPRDLKIIGHID